MSLFFVFNYIAKPKHPAKTNVQQEHSLISPVKGQPNQFNGCQVGLWWQFAVSYFLGGVHRTKLALCSFTATVLWPSLLVKTGKFSVKSISRKKFREDDFTENLCINIFVGPALILGYYMRRDRPSVHIGTIGAGFAIHSFVGLNGRHFWSRAKWSACLLKELSLRRSQVPILMTNSYVYTYSTSLLFRGRKNKIGIHLRITSLSCSKEHKKGKSRCTWRKITW